MLFGLERARERLRDQRPFEARFGRACRRYAGRRGEHVDGLEDKVARERPAEVRHAGGMLVTNIRGLAQQAQLT